jgi:hypothetical protein
MQTSQADYFSAYRQLKLTRDAKGVLVVEFHSKRVVHCEHTRPHGICRRVLLDRTGPR